MDANIGPDSGDSDSELEDGLLENFDGVLRVPVLENTSRIDPAALEEAARERQAGNIVLTSMLRGLQADPVSNPRLKRWPDSEIVAQRTPSKRFRTDANGANQVVHRPPYDHLMVYIDPEAMQRGEEVMAHNVFDADVARQFEIAGYKRIMVTSHTDSSKVPARVTAFVGEATNFGSVKDGKDAIQVFNTRIWWMIDSQTQQVKDQIAKEWLADKRKHMATFTNRCKEYIGAVCAPGGEALQPKDLKQRATQKKTGGTTWTQLACYYYTEQNPGIL